MSTKPKPKPKYEDPAAGMATNENKNRYISVARFAFVMKALAENDLWDEAIVKMEEHGFDEIYVDPRHVDILKDVIKGRLDTGDAVNKRGVVFLGSVRCLKPPKHP